MFICASGSLQISPRDGHPYLQLMVDTANPHEDFYLLEKRTIDYGLALEPTRF